MEFILHCIKLLLVILILDKEEINMSMCNRSILYSSSPSIHSIRGSENNRNTEEEEL